MRSFKNFGGVGVQTPWTPSLATCLCNRTVFVYRVCTPVYGCGEKWQCGWCGGGRGWEGVKIARDNLGKCAITESKGRSRARNNVLARKRRQPPRWQSHPGQSGSIDRPPSRPRSLRRGGAGSARTSPANSLPPPLPRSAAPRITSFHPDRRSLFTRTHVHIPPLPRPFRHRVCPPALASHEPFAILHSPPPRPRSFGRSRSRRRQPKSCQNRHRAPGRELRDRYVMWPWWRYLRSRVVDSSDKRSVVFCNTLVGREGIVTRGSVECTDFSRTAVINVNRLIGIEMWIVWSTIDWK